MRATLKPAHPPANEDSIVSPKLNWPRHGGGCAQPPLVRATHPKLCVPSTAPLALPLDQFTAWMNQRVRHQAHATAIVVRRLREAARPRPAPEDPSLRKRPNIITLTLCGPSGYGKTEMMRYAIPDALGGQVPTHIINAATYADETSVTRTTGASAGFEACTDGNSLAEQLARLTQDQRLVRLEKLDKRTREYRELAEQIEEHPAFQAPPLIYIQIDEIDKGHPSLLGVLNNLLDEGHITGARGAVFAPDYTTTLLIVCTTNHGAHDLAHMPSRDVELARSFIQAHMRKGGTPDCPIKCGPLQPCVIERLGTILPFFRLKDEEMREILSAKFHSYLCEKKRISPYLQPLSCSQDVTSFLTERVMRTMHVEHGIRGAQKRLFDEIRDTLEDALSVLEQGMRVPRELSLFIERFSLQRLQQLQDGMVKLLLNAPEKKLEVERQCEQPGAQQVTALGVRAADLGVLVLNVIAPPPVIQVQMTINNTAPQAEAENRELKQTLKELSRLTPAKDLYERTREILRRKRHLLDDVSSCDDDVEDEAATTTHPHVHPLLRKESDEKETKRKRCDNEAEEEAQKKPKQQQTVTLDVKIAAPSQIDYLETLRQRYAPLVRPVTTSTKPVVKVEPLSHPSFPMGRDYDCPLKTRSRTRAIKYNASVINLIDD